MDLKQHRSKLIGSDDERAVSPVIGVILMVAITVILAAVIAAFVLDMGQGQSQSAQAGVDMTENTDGDIEVTVNTVERANELQFQSGCSGSGSNSGFDSSGPPTIEDPSAGDTATIDCDNSADATVQVVGTYDGSENVITTFEK